MNKKLIWYFLIFILVIFGFRFTCYNVLSGLDSSWVYALNNIHINGEYIFGKDVFFTFGPLGYLMYPTCYKEILLKASLFKIFTIIMFLFSLFCFEKRKYANIFLTILSLDFILFGFEGYEFLAVLLSMVCLFAKNIKGYLGLIFLNIFAFCMLFVKFNVGISCIATLILTLVALKFKRNFVILSFLFWIISIGFMTYFYFGDIHTLINWFSKSLIIASGYSESMLLWKHIMDQLYLLSAWVIIGLYISLWIDECKKGAKYSKVFLVILPSMFFMFKSGFVRADLHMLAFFTYILAIVPLLFFFVKNISLKKLIIMYVLALLLPIHYISYNSIFSLISYFNNKSITVSDDYLLPSSWLEKIKNSKVEILPYDFGYLQKNNLTPHYNPILQLYAVYTKSLDDLSAENYKADGPEFTETQEYITETKNKLESCKTKYKDYLTEEKIMSYVADKNLDSYYIDFYKNEIIGDLEEERKDNTVETSINELVNYLEKTEEIIKFLKENKDFWVIQNDNIVFSKDVSENKYNELISNLYESE